ncbi:MAG: hypothetical protein NT030_04700 [Candidatus Saganbacteria bacterium]|nr:hypothetical protein [Candidatus Saganbacteria bacterium]
MRTIIVLAIILLLPSHACASCFGIGARAMGMGGAYTALANDITAAYWNPAGLIRSKSISADGMLGLGFYGDLTLSNLIALSDPDKFAQDNWNNNVNIVGSVNGIIGGSFNKIGISYIPWGSVVLTKPFSNLPLIADANFKHSFAITFGRSFDAPYLLLGPLSVGANVKYITGQLRRRATIGLENPAPVTFIDATTSGIGLDLGLEAEILPMVTFGLVLKDILTGLIWSGKTKEYSSLDEKGRPIGKLGEEDFSEAESTPMGIAMGIAANLPEIAILSADIENRGQHTDVHLGAESAFMAVAVIRVGFCTDSFNQTMHITGGLGAAVGPGHADIGMTQDLKTDKNRALLLSFSATF